ncbi:DUF1629 domain-containing protein [Sorangium sp. So ce327]|uniref:imm11 family protein n=1 Tax=Sorangium sp. So ce327 TaxID=3133301 RepID=UPI003F604516
MHYVLSFRSHDRSCIPMLPRPEIHGHPALRFNSGARIDERLPVIEFRQGADHQGSIPDYVPTALAGMVVSSRFRHTLEAAGVDNIDYHDARILNTVTGAALDSYYVANIVGRVACLDRENSVVEPAPGIPDAILEIYEMVLDYNRIGDLRMFRLHELPFIVIVDQGVKEAIERAQITGVRLSPADGYST